MTLGEAFENITDARIERCKKHNLVDILKYILCSVVQFIGRVSLKNI